MFKILFIKDWRVSLRQGSAFLSALFLAVLIILILDISFANDVSLRDSKILAMIWIATLFGSIMSLNRSFEAEAEGHVWERLALLHNLGPSIYLSKLLLNLCQIFLLLTLCILSALFFHSPGNLVNFLVLTILPLLVAALGIGIVGTTFSFMVSFHAKKDLLLPVIFYPLLVPVILGVFQCVEISPQGYFISLRPVWLLILAAYDLIFLILSLILFETMLRE